jgi:hypothetical protein
LLWVLCLWDAGQITAEVQVQTWWSCSRSRVAVTTAAAVAREVLLEALQEHEQH